MLSKPLYYKCLYKDYTMKFKKTLKAVIKNLLWFVFLAIPVYLVVYVVIKLSFLISEGSYVSFPLELAYQLYPLMELVSHIVGASVSVVVAVIGLYFINRFLKRYPI